MLPPRTPHWVIQLRFVLTTAPVGIFFGLAFGWYFFFFTVLFTWLIIVVTAKFVDISVYCMDSKAYAAVHRAGAHPFYDNLWPPFNCDSTEVRLQHGVYDCTCPRCNAPIVTPRSGESYCRCGLCLHENTWWIWNGEAWSVYFTYVEEQKSET